MSKHISTVDFGPAHPDTGISYTAEFGDTPHCEFGPYGWAVYVTYPDGVKDWQDNGFAGSAREALDIVLAVHRDALDYDARHADVSVDDHTSAWWRMVSADARPAKFRWPYERNGGL